MNVDIYSHEYFPDNGIITTRKKTIGTANSEAHYDESVCEERTADEIQVLIQGSNENNTPILHRFKMREDGSLRPKGLSQKDAIIEPHAKELEEDNGVVVRVKDGDTGMMCFKSNKM